MTAADRLLPARSDERTRRIVGIDLTRLVAIVGMMAAHLVAPLGGDPQAPGIDQLLGKVIGATVSSTSATTFAVLGGVSLVLLTRAMRGASAWRMLLALFIRGLLIAAVGALLDPLDGPISVVLTFYGIALIIAAPALLLPSWAVAAAAGALWICGGAVNAQVQATLGPSPIAPDPAGGATVLHALRELVLTGHYPAITWVAYMLVGILIARALLTARAEGGLQRLCVRLAAWGLAVYLAITIGGRIVRMRPEWFGLPDLRERMLSSGFGAPIGTDLWMLLIPTPHSGNPADMLRTVAGACFAIGLLVALFDTHRVRTGFGVAALRAAGAAPLTIYTAHVVMTTFLYQLGRRSAVETGAVMLPWYAQSTAVFLLQLAGVIGIGVVLAALRRRGPLETLLGWASGSSRPRRAESRG